MGALFDKKRSSTRTAAAAVELTLDMTPDAVTLCKRKPHGSWRKFDAVQLDDPEFANVLGLLRADAEAYAGACAPVRLWLPPDQILQKRAWVGDNQPEVLRLPAAFDFVARETVCRPQDVAVAVGPADDDGMATTLITFAKTWQEARDYAARWGFLPGPVSTHHAADDFGAAGPEFSLCPEEAPEPAEPGRRVPLVLAIACALRSGDRRCPADPTPLGRAARPSRTGFGSAARNAIGRTTSHTCRTAFGTDREGAGRGAASHSAASRTGTGSNTRPGGPAGAGATGRRA